jgi:HEAT repeat protein
MPASERIPLRRRALNLLERAARGGRDVVRANAIEALANLAPEENIAIFREAVASDFLIVRYAGCLALGDSRDTSSSSVLRNLRRSQEDRLRMAAAYASYRCGDTDAAEVLVDILNTHPNEQLRADAAFLIGRLEEPRAAARLRLAQRREKSHLAKLHIVAALATLGDEDSIDALIYYTQSDVTSRLIALQTLAEIAPPRARGALLRVLNDTEFYLQGRLIAARALGELRDASGYQLALESLSYKAKEAAETMQVRVNAALALGAIGRSGALGALQRLAETENDQQTQVAACYAICRIAKASSGW